MERTIPLLVKGKIIAHEIVTNLSTAIKQKMNRLETLSGSIHLKKNPEKASKYAIEVLDDYLKVGELDIQDLKDAVILEVGPGDNFGVSLLLIAMGAKKVTCIDKFAPKRDENFELELYTLLSHGLTGEEKERFDNAISIARDGFTINAERIEFIAGCGLEDSGRQFSDSTYDLILSRAVLQYIDDIDGAFQSMDFVLKPGGKMVHFVDLRDVGTFTGPCKDINPLTFLTISNPLWKLMTSSSPRPNRKRVGYYERILEKYGHEYRIGIYRVFGRDEMILDYPDEIVQGIHYDDVSLELVREVRASLAKDIKDLPDDRLLISGIAFFAKKT